MSYPKCHNGFLPRLGRPQKYGVATDLFCTGVIGHPGQHVSKLGIEIPNQNDTTDLRSWVENLKFGSLITCEEGLAPSQRPSENGTN